METREKLIAHNGLVSSETEGFLFSISLTKRMRELINNEGKKQNESWLEYRKRTELEREQEEKKSIRIAQDIVDAYNEKYNL